MERLQTQAVQTERREGVGPTERYIQWLQTEFSANHWEADPQQPCLLYKTYPMVAHIPLDGDIPLQLGKEYAQTWEHLPVIQQATPAQKLSWLLYYTHGLTRVLRPVAGKATSLGKSLTEDTRPQAHHIGGPTAHFSPMLGRPVPSGGNLHPVEMYLALDAQWTLPAGIYHYDSAHHRLDLLRAGAFMANVLACLPAAASPVSAVLFLSTCIQKNHQKYTQFSYLLQTLDTGIVLEQLRFVSKQIGFSSTIQRCFADYPLHAILGLDTQEELIYATLPLHINDSHLHRESTRALTPLLTIPHAQPFQPRRLDPLLQELYAASISSVYNEQTENLGKPVGASPPTHVGEQERDHSQETEAMHEEEVRLPLTSPPQKHDMAQILLRRHTSSQSIDTREISLDQVAALLQPLRTIEEPLWHFFDCQIYCTATRVTSLAPDAYRYCRTRHTLIPLHVPELLPLLMRISIGSYIQSQLPPLNLFFCGDYQKARTQYGERGLRMLGIEIGRMVACITLNAAINELGSHVHVQRSIEGIRKRLLHIASASNLPLASMMVGHKRDNEENLFEMAWY
jgi:SagB-type dehydrogenase family enzyme